MTVTGTPPALPPSGGYPLEPRPPERRPARPSALRRLLAALAAVGGAVAKFGAVLVKFKALVVVGSMFVSVAAYAWLFGWPFAVGFVLLILVHELGHVVVLRRLGIRSGLPVFLPFLGAFVRVRSAPRSVRDEAVSALAGPVFGSAAAAGCWYAATAMESRFLLALAFAGFFINLFNLLPALPLDGGRVAGALHPALWLAGLVVLLGVEVWRPSPVIPLVLVLGGIELWRRWRTRHTPGARRYLAVDPGRRAALAAAYVGLIGLVLVAMHATYVKQQF